MKRTFFTLIITPLILSVFVPNVYAHTAIYKYGYENGKIDGALGQLLDGDASGVCDKYSSSKQTETGVQYDKCAEGYSDGYNHFYGKSLKIFAKIDHVPAKPEYKYGYKFGENSTLSTHYFDPTVCDVYNATQQIRICKQGYLDSVTMINGLFKRMPEYKVEYRVGKVDGNQSAACSLPGDSTNFTKQNACDLGHQDGFNSNVKVWAKTPEYRYGYKNGETDGTMDSAGSCGSTLDDVLKINATAQQNDICEKGYSDGFYNSCSRQHKCDSMS